LEIKSAQCPLMDDQGRVTGDDKILGFVRCTPEAIPTWLFALLMKEWRNFIFGQIIETERDERRHSMVPVSVRAPIEHQQPAVGSQRWFSADALATCDPQHRCDESLFAGRRIQDKKRLRVAIGLEIFDDRSLFFGPKFRRAVRGIALDPGFD